MPDGPFEIHGLLRQINRTVAVTHQGCIFGTTIDWFADPRLHVATGLSAATAATGTVVAATATVGAATTGKRRRAVASHRREGRIRIIMILERLLH